MSQTATSTARNGLKGLAIERRFSSVGTHPFDELEWETRDAVIGDPDGSGGWTVRIYHEPLVPWIWAGSLIMVAGGFVSLSDRRLRIGVPRRRAKAQAAAAASA